MNHSLEPRRRVNARRCSGRRLQLEALETRLPLGEALLSTLLGSSLLASSPSRDDSSYQLWAGMLTEAWQANHGQAHLGTGSVNETDTSGTAPIVSLVPFRLQGQPSEAQGGNAQTLAVHVVADRDSGAFSWSSNGVLFGIGDDLDSALTGDPLCGFIPFWDAAAVSTRRHFAGSSAAEGNSFSGSGVVSMPTLTQRAADSGFRMVPLVTEGAALYSSPRAADPNYYFISPPAIPPDPSVDPAIPSESDWDPAGGMPPPSGAVHALFDLSTPTSGPFPSNWFTVADQTQNTGKRINLPLPDCQTHPSDCEDVNVLNTLDGFNLQPRLSVPLDGPIDVNSVSSNTVFLVSLGDTLNHHDHGGQVVGINQVVWDVESNALHVESGALLDQHTRYALIVTNGVHAQDGRPVEASEAFQQFRHDVRGEYRHELLDAIHAARRAGVRERDIVTASVFTTQSATAVLEKIRDQIHAASVAQADFNLGPGGTRTVFPFDDGTSMTFNEQVSVDPPSFNPVTVNLDLLRTIDPGAVGEIAFGKYLSPDYEVHPGEYIPLVATRTGTPVVQSMNEVYFNLILPSGLEPAGGWPVAIFGHGTGGNKNQDPLFVAATMAEHGIATIAINAVGHGFGPDSMLTVGQTIGDPVTFSEGGRAFDQDGDHVIGNPEGSDATAPRTIIRDADGLRQTGADLMQLVREIEVGMDIHGNGSRDLDPSRIYYLGFSRGSLYGTPFVAVEPDVQASDLTVGGGARIEGQRLGVIFRPAIGTLLAARTPALINSPGITRLDGIPIAAPGFNENMPLRDGHALTIGLSDGTTGVIQSPVVNTVPGAMAIQEYFENLVWVSQSANMVAYAPHLRRDPLPGVPVRPVILQFDKGDQVVPNPTQTAPVRAGGLADRTTFYRTDLAVAEDPTVTRNAHGFLAAIASPIPLVAAVARGAQEQIGTFFETDGRVVIHPEPARFFETPINLPLPEDLNYIP